MKIDYENMLKVLLLFIIFIFIYDHFRIVHLFGNTIILFIRENSRPIIIANF